MKKRELKQRNERQSQTIVQLAKKLDALELEKAQSAARFDGIKPYTLAESASLYVSGDDVYDTALALLMAAGKANADPTNLVLTVGYIPADTGAKHEEDRASYFAGQVTVSV